MMMLVHLSIYLSLCWCTVTSLHSFFKLIFLLFWKLVALVFLSRCSPFTICDETEISQYCALMLHLETPLGPIWVDKPCLRQGCGLGLLSPPIELAIDP